MMSVFFTYRVDNDREVMALLMGAPSKPRHVCIAFLTECTKGIQSTADII